MKTIPEYKAFGVKFAINHFIVKILIKSAYKCMRRMRVNVIELPIHTDGYGDAIVLSTSIRACWNCNCVNTPE